MNLTQILAERLAIVGGTGSGKSYTARVLVEKLLATAHGRVGIIDPTGVWHGLRVLADGKSAGYPVVIFGGDRSDVALVETAGRVVAQAVAATHQSWIIDTSALKTKAAERRFMLDFLDALFETNRADITLVVDEADRFSPQRMSPETARLHERMEEIVRRGRVRGFTPWLITQRPASLNKDVLSQATAMICMRMTGKHDRDAMGAVIEGQADKATAKAIVDAMPRHKVGSGLVWAPQQDVLVPVQFPKIVTLDTMRAPKPGERRRDEALPPIDLGALREKLATVEAETKANDPKALKAEIARLKAELAKKPAAAPANPKAEEEAFQRGWRLGDDNGRASILTACEERIADAMAAFKSGIERLNQKWPKLQRAEIPAMPRATPSPGVTPGHATVAPQPSTRIAVPSTPAAKASTVVADGLSRPQQRILDALAWLESVRIASADRTRVAWLSDASPKSSAFMNNLGSLSSKGLIMYPRPGDVRMTDEGRALANAVEAPLTNAALHASIRAKLPRPQWAIIEAVIDAHPDALSREALASRAGASHTSSAFMNNLGSLRSLGLIDYPMQGHVAATDFLFVEG